MDRSANQSRLSLDQLFSQKAGNVGLSIDQLTDLDQAINATRGDNSAASRPAAMRPAFKPPAKASLKPASKTPSPNPASPAITSVKPASTTSVLDPSIQSDEPAPTPVRSAKEAINAMYSGENPARLSDYLGASAKEIINASARNNAERDSKSAASLHHSSSQRKMESARPSASALFRMAKSEKTTTSVVRTSLELDPQQPGRPQSNHTDTTSIPVSLTSSARSNAEPGSKTAKTSPIIINSRSRAANPRAFRPVDSLVRPQKGQIRISTPSPAASAVEAIGKAAGIATVTASSAHPPKAASVASSARSSKTIKPSRPRGGLVQDIARPVKPRPSTPVSPATQPQPTASPRKGFKAFKSLKNSKTQKTASLDPGDPRQKLPADSVKRHFRLAPKGFAANKPEQARPARRKFMSFSNPDYTVPIPKPTPAVEIYGLMDEKPAAKADKSAKSGSSLGIVEDYRPANPTNPAMNTSASDRPASSNDTPGQKSTPDNNRYALGGQSPFFLKTVSVEKRPLSDAPTRRADTISPIYTSSDSIPKKNLYTDKAPKPQKSAKKVHPRDLPQRPTVIIPENRRSHTPLFLLLVLTVILGAVVGAAVYFFFFQQLPTPGSSNNSVTNSSFILQE